MTTARTRCVICDDILIANQRKYCSSECRKRSGREQWVKRTYGISLEAYDEILRYQDGKCAICRRPPAPGTHLAVDHEHGAHVRGLLCRYCNRNVVGRLKDPQIAQRLADYLRDPPAVAVLGVVIAPGRPKRKRRRRKQ